MVFLDIGGVLYDDGVYARSWQRALREAGGSFTDDEFAEEYRLARASQSGSFRRRLADRFLGPGLPIEPIEEIAARYWAYPPEALLPDVRPCLEVLSGRYRLGIVANQPAHVREAMVRDGLEGYFEVWGVSGDVGLEKPDPRLFAHVLYVAGVAPPRAAMVGDRLDYDVRPARTAGMKAVWVLRGEAPDEPTPSQLAEADAAVRSLEELPGALERL
ncbi:MAG: HAD family hydrolase [Actinobacteria bacterium]|nr:HAD family hydrolase [Actinomycetota bacterium]